MEGKERGRKAAAGSHKTGEISPCAASGCQYMMIKRVFFFPAKDFLNVSLSSPSEQL